MSRRPVPTASLAQSDAAAAPAEPAARAPLALPSGAEEHDDGSVTYALDKPFTIMGKSVDSVRLRPLTGAEVARVADSRNSDLQLAIAAGLKPSEAAAWSKFMNARDASALNRIQVAQMNPDGVGIGTLPDEAETIDDAIHLTRLGLVLHDLTAQHRRQVGEVTGTQAMFAAALAASARDTAMTPRAAGELLDGLDAPDWMVVTRTLGFLLGAGR